MCFVDIYRRSTNHVTPKTRRFSETIQDEISYGGRLQLSKDLHHRIFDIFVNLDFWIFFLCMRIRRIVVLAAWKLGKFLACQSRMHKVCTVSNTRTTHTHTIAAHTKLWTMLKIISSTITNTIIAKTKKKNDNNSVENDHLEYELNPFLHCFLFFFFFQFSFFFVGIVSTCRNALLSANGY